MEPNTNIFTVSRADMKKILDIVSPGCLWQKEIPRLTTEHGDIFSDKVYLPKDVVRLMFEAANGSQKTTLKTIFPTYGENTIEEVVRKLAKDTVYFYYTGTDCKRIILEDGFVKLELPNTNRVWSFEAFDLCKAICSACTEAYPVHTRSLDGEYLHIKIVKV